MDDAAGASGGDTPSTAPTSGTTSGGRGGSGGAEPSNGGVGGTVEQSAGGATLGGDAGAADNWGGNAESAGAGGNSVAGIGGAGGAAEGGVSAASGAGGASACNGAIGAFSDAFATLDVAHWTTSQTTPNLYTVDAAQGDVRLAKTDGNPAGFQNIAVVLNVASVGGPVAGDFEEFVSFSNASLGANGTYQVELHAYFEDGSFFFVVYDNSSGLNVHVWNGALNGAKAIAQTAGRFRISRVGTSLAAYLDSTLVWSTTSSSPLTGAEFSLQVQPGATGAESVTFDDFELQGACVGG